MKKWGLATGVGAQGPGSGRTELVQHRTSAGSGRPPPPPPGACAPTHLHELHTGMLYEPAHLCRPALQPGGVHSWDGAPPARQDHSQAAAGLLCVPRRSASRAQRGGQQPAHVASMQLPPVGQCIPAGGICRQVVSSRRAHCCWNAQCLAWDSNCPWLPRLPARPQVDAGPHLPGVWASTVTSWECCSACRAADGSARLQKGSGVRGMPWDGGSPSCSSRKLSNSPSPDASTSLHSGCRGSRGQDAGAVVDTRGAPATVCVPTCRASAAAPLPVPYERITADRAPQAAPTGQQSLGDSVGPAGNRSRPTGAPSRRPRCSKM